MRPTRWSWPALLALCACGGGGSVADLTGTWWLTPVEGGVPGDGVHLTLVQTGSALAATATCRADFPPGTGSWDGATFALAFEFGPGAVLTLAAAGGTGGGLAGTYTDPDGLVGAFTLTRNALVLDCAHACDEVVVPRFVDVDFTDLAKIEEVSLFRSSAGHDYSDACETCRSMKHYFAPYLPFRVNGAVPVFAPVDGQIVSVAPEGHGASPGLVNKQVRIRSALHPEVTFILFHIDLASAAVAPGALVAAGDPLGHARLYYDDLNETAHDFDVGVRVHTPFGERYVSWFDVVTDTLFAAYAARGVPDRAALVLTQAARDADPLTCMGSTFTSAGALPAWFVLNPP
jgi:hypothetical protein